MNREIMKAEDSYDFYKEETLMLHDRINKAIEYLKENACYTDNNEFVCDLRYDNCEELLDILKGCDNNDNK